MTKNSAASFLALCCTVSLILIIALFSFHNPSALKPIYQIQKLNQNRGDFQGLKPWRNRSSKLITAIKTQQSNLSNEMSQRFSLQEVTSQLQAAVESLKLNERLITGETTVDLFPCPDEMGGGKLQCQYYSPDWRGISDIQSVLSKRISRVRYDLAVHARVCVCVCVCGGRGGGC